MQLNAEQENLLNEKEASLLMNADGTKHKIITPVREWTPDAWQAQYPNATPKRTLWPTL